MTHTRLPVLLPLAFLVALPLTSCDEEIDEPSVVQAALTIYGEQFIEVGIDPELIAEGYSITFSSFIVQLADIQLGNQTIADISGIELARPSQSVGHPVGSVTLTAGSYTDMSFTIPSIRVVGTASRDQQTWSFDWTIPVATRFDQCETPATVRNSGPADAQITIHADHLLYDSLVADEPALSFQAFVAADTDQNLVITTDELEAAGIGTLDPGNESPQNLWQWLLLASRTIGHFNGEGHCTPAPAEG
jgi:hypothetical protein